MQPETGACITFIGSYDAAQWVYWYGAQEEQACGTNRQPMRITPRWTHTGMLVFTLISNVLLERVLLYDRCSTATSMTLR